VSDRCECPLQSVGGHTFEFEDPCLRESSIAFFAYPEKPSAHGTTRARHGSSYARTAQLSRRFAIDLASEESGKRVKLTIEQGDGCLSFRITDLPRCVVVHHDLVSTCRDHYVGATLKLDSPAYPCCNARGIVLLVGKCPSHCDFSEVVAGMMWTEERTKRQHRWSIKQHEQ